VSRRAVWIGAGAAGLGVLAAAAAWALSGGDATAADTTAKATATARVERRDLVQRESFDGTLGYADSRTLAAAATGTLTRLAAEGSVVRRGGVLYGVDGSPVYLMDGGTPAWRTLGPGVEDGRDVRQLERNLVALGYDPDGDIEVDDEFDWATEAAVRRWEEGRGATQDGVVELGEIVFLPAPRRIGTHAAALGSAVQPGIELMDTSATRRVVTVGLDASRQDLVAKGDAVRVELPGGMTVAGRISKVGTVAESPATENPGEEVTPTVEVTISLLGRSGTGLDQAPVDVLIAKESKRNVIVVPVSALLALAGGGYGVEVAGDTGTRLVAVEPGLQADGYVEVSGGTLSEGDRVVVPR
jgi:peptidoglycan hydrolase-like protein with peptidoglycan-binding domain